MSVYNFTLATVGLKILSCPEVCLFKMLKQRWTLSRSVVCGFNSLCAMRLIYMQTMKSYSYNGYNEVFYHELFFPTLHAGSLGFFFFLGITKTERKKFSISPFSVTLTVLISVWSGEVYSKIQLMSLCKQSTVKQIKLAELLEAFYCSEICSSYRVCIAGDKNTWCLKCAHQIVKFMCYKPNSFPFCEQYYIRFKATFYM